MDESKLQTLLEPDDVLGSNRVRAPEGFVEVLAIPAAEFSGAVVDVIEWATALEDALQLAKLAHVATCVERYFDVSAQAEADFVRLMMQIAGDDVMPALAQLSDQAGADRSQPACDEDSRHLVNPVESCKSCLRLAQDLQNVSGFTRILETAGAQADVAKPAVQFATAVHISLSNFKLVSLWHKLNEVPRHIFQMDFDLIRPSKQWQRLNHKPELS